MYCPGCSHDPCIYPIQQIDLREIAYRWFDPEYYERIGAVWIGKMLGQFQERYRVLIEAPRFPPDNARPGVFQNVVQSMYHLGMVNPLIVQRAVRWPIVAEGHRVAFGDGVVAPVYWCSVGNQRLCVLRVMWYLGLLKTPMVACRLALPTDPNTDSTPAIRNHPYQKVVRDEAGHWKVHN